MEKMVSPAVGVLVTHDVRHGARADTVGHVCGGIERDTREREDR